jgi:SAM-dependent methyltransferase
MLGVRRGQEGELTVDEIGQAVRAWYSDPDHSSLQTKDEGWAEEILHKRGELLRGKDVLNLGCSYPEDEIRYADLARSWTAIDFSPEVVERAKVLVPNVTFLVMDMTRLEFPGAFDVVLDHSSGDHLPKDDFERLLVDIRRLLRPGGKLVEVFTNLDYMRQYEGWGADQTFTSRFGYERADRPEDMAAMLTAAGFRIVTSANLSTARCGYLAEFA